jgi:hypothetical protein
MITISRWESQSTALAAQQLGIAGDVVGGPTQQHAEVRRAIDIAIAVEVHRIHLDALLVGLPTLEMASRLPRSRAMLCSRGPAGRRRRITGATGWREERIHIAEPPRAQRGGESLHKGGGRGGRTGRRRLRWLVRLLANHGGRCARDGVGHARTRAVLLAAGYGKQQHQPNQHPPYGHLPACRAHLTTLVPTRTEDGSRCPRFRGPGPCYRTRPTWDCGFRNGNRRAPATARSLNRKMLSPSVMLVS